GYGYNGEQRDPPAVRNSRSVPRICRQPPSIHVLLQPLQIASNFRSMLEAQLAILLKALGDNTLEFSGQVRVQLQGRDWCAIQNGIKHAALRRSRERQLAGSHFIEHNAEGK